MADILVYAEVGSDGSADTTALELLTKARELGSVDAVALGPGASSIAEKLGEHGAGKVFVNDDDVFADYVAQPAAEALAQLVQQEQPQLVLFATNYESRDVAGRLSAKLGATLMSNATGLVDLDTAQTAIFGGSTIVDVKLEGSPKIVLVRPKSFVPEPSGGSASVEQLSVEISDDLKKAKRIERHEEAASGPRLDQAAVVISGGRGLQEPDNFKLLDELADAIGGAAVGATRAVVDAGWVPYSYQIGQTGITVKPGVYLAFGISGATQHIVGMKGSKRIIAVNKDEEAPIFQLADLGVVGDALKVLPQLIEEVKSRKG
ncbi:MAG TPA: electron transfer flavoprotein subunit alpha/FixB family protein [Actinomycetota bacterium]|jgi:electron transfer flavoprotein alpha subunit|nr:electron transfer flavoprotein subunit alpha/FixB family protein [Actinomycetota bacterium]